MKPEFRFCVECKHHSQDFRSDGLKVAHKCGQSLGTRDMVTGRFLYPECHTVREKMCQGRWFEPKTQPEPKISGGLFSRILKLFK